MASDRVVQFKIPKTNISYSLKLTYDDAGVLESIERQETRRADRSVEFRMLTSEEKNKFVSHLRDKVYSLPIVRQ